MALNNSHNDKDSLEPIAIVGLSLRFPAGATDLDRFFNLITEARCVSQEFPPARLDVRGAYWPKAAAASPTVRGGHFLAEDITAFDAPFFGISAVEAASMDPQQRLLLETSYVALENAGIPIQNIAGSNTSVYVGCFTDDYRDLYRKDVRDSAPYAATGITTTLNANRVSWFYNFMGPSINVDTACSSSLVALDLACQALRAGQTEMCLAGGANLILAPDLFHILSEMSMLSPDSRSYSFDARGNGYGRGEGVAMLVLKRLSCALRDGDTIRAVVRSTACNQNGYTPGITQPSKSAQEALINECYARAGLDKARTGYVEAHGTGTPAGDPIEAEALGASFRDSRRPGERLYVGSVKANIGHLEGASGIAGVIKAVAMLERGWIPAIADLQSINSMIDEAQLRLQFPRSGIPWPRPGLRRISVNSFGFGGSNAHAVLDDAYHFILEHQLDGVAYRPRTDSSSPQEEIIPVHVLRDQRYNVGPPPLPSSSLPVAAAATAGVQHKRVRLLPLSSSDKAGITRTVTSLTGYFLSRGGGAAGAMTPPSVEFSDALAYTLAQRRTFLSWRAYAVVPANVPLHEFQTMVSPAVKLPKTAPKIAFVFTGQGAQWAQMGLDLCVYSVFRRRLEEADEDLCAFGCDWRLLDELAKPTETSQINEPRISQVLCTVIQIALVDLLYTFGITCSVVIGHSSGEIAAAYCCGAISARSAWRIAFLRGALVSAKLQESTIPGAMLAVGLSAAEAASYLARSNTEECKRGSSRVSIACFNSPNNVTLSGDEAAIDALKADLDAAGIFTRKLRTGVAYHSSHLHSVADAYAGAIEGIEPGQHDSEQGLLQRTGTAVVMVSTVSGQRVPAEILRQGNYWASNLVRPVRFLQAFQSLLSKRGVAKKLDGSHRLLMNITTCVEIGPHGALRGPIKEILRAQDHPMTYLATLQRAQPGADALLRSLGDLWCLGLSINWNRVNHEFHSSETGSEERPGVMAMPPAPVSLADLPPYAWEHSRRFFHESRTSRNHRLRSRPRSKLLGEAAVDWNALEARWGNFLKRSEHPWIEDHQINGTILFPAAGMMAMAVEAMKQQVQLAGAAPNDRPVLGYELRDIHLSTALVIPDHERGVEVQF
ncbi:type I Iterative Polyketide synthase (PKS), partial [Aspergillus brasiliensis]